MRNKLFSFLCLSIQKTFISLCNIQYSLCVHVGPSKIYCRRKLVKWISKGCDSREQSVKHSYTIPLKSSCSRVTYQLLYCITCLSSFNRSCILSLKSVDGLSKC